MAWLTTQNPDKKDAIPSSGGNDCRFPVPMVLVDFTILIPSALLSCTKLHGWSHSGPPYQPIKTLPPPSPLPRAENMTPPRSELLHFLLLVPSKMEVFCRHCEASPFFIPRGTALSFDFPSVPTAASVIQERASSLPRFSSCFFS